MNVEQLMVTRVPVSLRLPADVAEQVEEYAQTNHLKKTEAYERFLRKGLQGESMASLADDVSHMRRQLDEVVRMMLDREEMCTDASPSLTEVSTAISRSAVLFPAIRRAILFGSFARGRPRDESDIDVRIELDRSLPFNLHDLGQFAKRVEQDTGREVDVVSADVIQNENLRQAIDREGVVVYEREE